MALSTGTRLGPYEIYSALGAGGMGEVYRSTDTVLKRQVALKVLPPEVANDPERVARFQREAEVLASLNHPNIAHLYGLERSGGTLALVMELVEGPTLADRIAQGAIPIDEALPIAKQIAEALEAAHEKGIIHRDLKPANIKVREDGTVKVLDFGLAKAMEPASGTRPNPSGMTNSPTITSPALMTGMGVLLGTAAYMSPEQAKGRAADKRSDVWAFGCVLYEMLTSRRAFEGEDVSDTLAAVLRGEPAWSAVPADLPTPIRVLLRRCLTKDRSQRVADMSVALFALIEQAALVVDAPTDAALVQRQIDAAVTAERDKAAATVAASTSALRHAMCRHLALGTVMAVLITGAIVSAIAWTLKPKTPALPVTRFTIALGEGQQFSANNHQSLAMSPDGTQLVYAANNQLYLRSLRDLEAHPIAGTQQTPPPIYPVFSPDGRSVAFFSQTEGAIVKIAVSGGAAVTICAAENPVLGISWSGGELLFGQTGKGILRVSENGGQAQTLIGAKDQEVLYGPQMLPGGEWVLFTSAAVPTNDGWDKARIVVQSVKSSERRTLISGGSDARYLPTGHLIYALAGVEFAVPFDVRHLTVTGGQVPVLPGVKRSTAATTGATHLVTSDTGSLAYEPGPVSAGGQTDLALFDRKTGAIQTFPVQSGAYEYPRLSPDGKRIVFGSDAGVVWIYELAGGSSARRLTVSGHDRFPVWVDAERVAFQSDREGDLGIFWQRADGATPPERLTKPDDKDAAHIPESWSPDGKTLLFAISKKSMAYTLATLSVPGKKVMSFAGIASSSPTAATFSPDGNWVAYTSSPAGIYAPSLFVQPFPPSGATYPISKGAGVHPLWSRDGKELIYANGPGQLLSVSVATTPAFTFGTPAPVARGLIQRGPPVERNIDILPDGRMVGMVPSGSTGAASAAQIQLILNWFEELKTRVPTR
jgi:serine/threonine-protein kinase